MMILTHEAHRNTDSLESRRHHTFTDQYLLEQDNPNLAFEIANICLKISLLHLTTALIKAA